MDGKSYYPNWARYNEQDKCQNSQPSLIKTLKYNGQNKRDGNGQ